MNRFAFLLALPALGFAAGCPGSSPIPSATGGAGGASSGAAGTGSGTGGSAGTQGAGTAGTGGGAATTGTAGVAGTAAVAGTAGAAGTGTAGTAGAAGRGGTTGTAGTGGRGGSAAGGAGGGATGTAGTTGAGGTSFPSCAGKTYKLCEDFETGTVGAFPTGWTALNGYGTDSMRGVGLASDDAHSGAMSLKSSSMIPGEQRVQHSLAALGATATKHWGRIFYKVISPSPRPASGNVIHVTMAALQGTTENRVVDTVEQSNGTHQWIYNVPDDSCCTGSAYNWSFDGAWHCAEWYVDVSTTSYRFFTDGMEVTSIGFTNKGAAAKMSSYTALGLGAIFYQMPPSPFTIWFDDLAIDDNQIGCN